MKRYKILGIGHPRTGTGYTSKMLQSFGLDVGHETLLKDGIVAWQFLIPPFSIAGRLPTLTDVIDYTNIKFDNVIYNTRNPLHSIPSIIKTENASFNWRSTWVPFSDKNTDVENAILSIYYTDMRIKELYQDFFTYRIEDQSDLLFSEMSKYFNISRNIKNEPLKNYNKKIDYNKEVDWYSVRNKYRKMINSFSSEYGYDLIY